MLRTSRNKCQHDPTPRPSIISTKIPRKKRLYKSKVVVESLSDVMVEDDEGVVEGEGTEDDSGCDWLPSHLMAFPTAQHLLKQIPRGLYQVQELDPAATLQRKARLSLENKVVSMPPVPTSPHD